MTSIFTPEHFLRLKNLKCMFTPLLKILGNMKPLMQSDVRQAFYELLEKNENTTVSEIRNLLKTRDYALIPKDFSEMIYEIALEDRMEIETQGRLRIYSYGGDSNEKAYAYLEKEDIFCEIRLEKKEISISSGMVGMEGKEHKIPFHKNFIASQFYHQFLSRKIRDGYKFACDLRIPSGLWQTYQHLAAERPVTCHIGYEDILKTEPNEELKTADYILSWNLPESLPNLKRVLEHVFWSNQQIGFDSARLLNEKTIGHRAIPASFPLLEMDNRRIFQVTLGYENGEEVVLYKSQMSLKEEMLPLVGKLIA
jgi:hypothetical protein